MIMKERDYTIVPVANEGLHQKRYGQPYYRIIEGNLPEIFDEAPITAAPRADKKSTLNGVGAKNRLTTIFRRLRVRRRGK